MSFGPAHSRFGCSLVLGSSSYVNPAPFLSLWAGVVFSYTGLGLFSYVWVWVFVVSLGFSMGEWADLSPLIGLDRRPSMVFMPLLK